MIAFIIKSMTQNGLFFLRLRKGHVQVHKDGTCVSHARSLFDFLVYFRCLHGNFRVLGEVTNRMHILYYHAGSIARFTSQPGDFCLPVLPVTLVDILGSKETLSRL